MNVTWCWISTEQTIKNGVWAKLLLWLITRSTWKWTATMRPKLRPVKCIRLTQSKSIVVSVRSYIVVINIAKPFVTAINNSCVSSVLDLAGSLWGAVFIWCGKRKLQTNIQYMRRIPKEVRVDKRLPLYVNGTEKLNFIQFNPMLLKLYYVSNDLQVSSSAWTKQTQNTYWHIRNTLRSYGIDHIGPHIIQQICVHSVE